MNKHSFKHHAVDSLHQPRTTSRALGIAVVLLVALVGVYVFVTSHAQSPYAATEAENGTLSGSAVVKTSTTASGGSYVQFSNPTVVGNSAAPGLTKGMVEDNVAADYQQDAIDMQTQGVKWDRGWLQCGSGASYVPFVQALEQHGVTFLPTYNCTTTTPIATYQSDLAADMQALAPYGVHVWEIGNEMDGGWTSQNNYCNNNSTPGQMACAEADYLPYLKAAYQTVHANDSKGAVIYGGLSDYNVNIGPWLTAMTNDQAWQWMDGMGYHPYGTTASATISGMNTLESYMVKNATWASKPIWITEYGCWSTGDGTTPNQCPGGTESAKTTYLTQSLDALKTWQTGTSFQLKTPICWYILHERPTSSANTTQAGFGLVQLNGSSRTYLPAFTAYENYTF